MTIKLHNILYYLKETINNSDIHVTDELKIIKAFKVLNEEEIDYTESSISDYLDEINCREDLKRRILTISDIIQLSYNVDSYKSSYYDNQYKSIYKEILIRT